MDSLCLTLHITLFDICNEAELGDEYGVHFFNLAVESKSFVLDMVDETLLAVVIIS